MDGNNQEPVRPRKPEEEMFYSCCRREQRNKRRPPCCSLELKRRLAAHKRAHQDRALPKEENRIPERPDCHAQVLDGDKEMERRSRCLRSQVGKTPIQKPLCRLCECPTSDGHVLASQVDRFKLRKWAMEVMNLTEEDENLPEMVEEDALICYFCIWQAEFGDESGDVAVAWWPKILDLEENAKVLRENYSVGEVEQCWVQLEEIDLAEYEKEIPKKRDRSGVCLYCGKRYDRLMKHVKLMHKEAIKCGIRGCMTYFHTEEEKEQHMQHYLHEKRGKPCESFRCNFCEIGKLYSSRTLWKQHMRRKHPELVACTHYGCIEYFKSKPEMILHVNAFHKQSIKQNHFECKHCEYFTSQEYKLKRHEHSKHMPKIFECDSCEASFGSQYLMFPSIILYHLEKVRSMQKIECFPRRPDSQKQR
ncbi:transcription factor E4F1-like [Cloeon dipterum]|uniref:transcription factor E4F1-like n=1 Tax=Cloeon dipterum TaxID=197152 RepID=UPI00321FE317